MASQKVFPKEKDDPKNDSDGLFPRFQREPEPPLSPEEVPESPELDKKNGSRPEQKKSPFAGELISGSYGASGGPNVETLKVGVKGEKENFEAVDNVNVIIGRSGRSAGLSDGSTTRQNPISSEITVHHEEDGAYPSHVDAEDRLSNQTNETPIPPQQKAFYKVTKGESKANKNEIKSILKKQKILNKNRKQPKKQEAQDAAQVRTPGSSFWDSADDTGDSFRQHLEAWWKEDGKSSESRSFDIDSSGIPTPAGLGHPGSYGPLVAMGYISPPRERIVPLIDGIDEYHSNSNMMRTIVPPSGSTDESSISSWGVSPGGPRTGPPPGQEEHKSQKTRSRPVVRFNEETVGGETPPLVRLGDLPDSEENRDFCKLAPEELEKMKMRENVRMQKNLHRLFKVFDKKQTRSEATFSVFFFLMKSAKRFHDLFF